MPELICQLCRYGEQQRVRYIIKNNLIPSWKHFFCYSHGEQVVRSIETLEINKDWDVKILDEIIICSVCKGELKKRQQIGVLDVKVCQKCFSELVKPMELNDVN